MPNRGLAVLVVGLLAGPLVTHAQAQPAPITGTITLHACTASPADFAVSASRIGAGGAVLHARVGRVSGSSRQFTFTIDTQAGDYVLNLHFKGACGPMMWNGPARGLVAGGETVALDGYAIRTRVEILGDAVGRPHARWVGADAFQFTDPTRAVRKLRVQTDVGSTSKFVLQIATDPFPMTGRAAARDCLEDGPSVVRTLAFNAVTFPTEGPTRVHPGGQDPEWTELPPIDFNALLLGTGHPGMVGTAPPLDQGALKMIRAGAPLYIRAIPATEAAAGPFVRHCDPDEDGLPGSLIVANIQNILEAQSQLPPPPRLRLYSAEYVGPTILPRPGPGDDTCVRAVAEHTLINGEAGNCPFGICEDKWGSYFIKYKSVPKYSVGDTIPIGERMCTPQSSGGGIFVIDALNAWADGITGLIDNIGGLVSDLAELWQAVKSKVVSIAADVIEAVGVPCDATCESGLMVGLNLALASAGIPPDLPNIQMLKGDARDWVATQIADQVAPGVPGADVLAKNALQYAHESLERYAAAGGGSGGSGLPSWLTLDVGLEPAVLFLTLQHVPSFEPPPLELLPDDTKVQIGENPTFAGAWFNVPRRFYMQPLILGPILDTVKVPIVLRPNLSKLPVNPYEKGCQDFAKGNSYVLSKCLKSFAYNNAIWNKQHWQTGITETSCAGFPLSWWKVSPDPAFPPPFNLVYTPLGFLGFLATPVLAHAFWTPPLGTPAFVAYCIP
jgi:hypothetical protein